MSITERSLRILARCAECNPTGPLLRNRDGRPWKSSALNGRFSRISAKLGVSVVPYHFRHAFWGRAVKAGVDSVIIARQLGHKDLSMLLKVYAHVDHSQTKDAVERAAQ